MLTPGERRILERIRTHARAGLPCPTNAEIAKMVGLTHRTVEQSMCELYRANRLRSTRVGSRRIITLVGEGIKTAPPVVEETVTVRPALRQIIDNASTIFGVGPRDITDATRLPHIVRARHAVCLVASERGWGPCAIARAINRDHSSAREGRKSAAERAKTDQLFAANVRALRELTPMPFTKTVALERAA